MSRRLKPLNQDEYKMKIIKDLGSIPTPSGNGKRRYAIFECNDCKKHFKARIGGSVIKKQERCITCRYTRENRNTSHPLYRVWNSIHQRCYNKKRKDYPRYGGRGVTMYREWVDNPNAFIQWCESNGWKKGLQVDKDIKSKELGINPPVYSPDTISFITPSENATEAIGKRVGQYTLDGEFIKEFPSLGDASESLGRLRSNTVGIQYACQGVYKHSGGFKWKYLD